MPKIADMVTAEAEEKVRCNLVERELPAILNTWRWKSCA
jgi:hypothetical protein